MNIHTINLCVAADPSSLTAKNRSAYELAKVRQPETSWRFGLAGHFPTLTEGSALRRLPSSSSSKI